jgi:arylsulfatase A-like enzyme
MTIRGQKGNMYQGGILVPGVMEWPKRIVQARTTNMISVTSDILPTLCDLTGQPMPDRPLDGISLVPVIVGQMEERPTPICFWSFETGKVFDDASQPYIDPALQEGTTPLVKMMAGKYTRTFRNFHYPEISEGDFGGARTIMDNRYKLVLDAQSGAGSAVELFDLLNDPAESENIADTQPEVVNRMQGQMRDWQRSVLESLTGADYR